MLTFDEAKHQYWWNDEILIPSVTQIMKATGISKDYSSVPIMALDKARRRGSAVHQITELIDKGLEPDMSTVDKDIYDDVCNMVDAWEAYKRDYEVEFVHIEEPVVLLDYLCITGDLTAPLYAGTVDRAIDLGGGEVGIVDIKTSSDLSQDVSIQLNLYAWGYRHYFEKDTTETQAVRLGKDGKYHLWRQEFLSDEWKRIAEVSQNLIYRYHNWEVHKNKRGMKRI
jgi:hypothetical protein